MDGRKSLLLVLSLLTATLGCSTTAKQTTGDQSIGRISLMKDEPVTSLPTEGAMQPHAPTCVAMGDYYAHEAAARDDAPALQSQMRDMARKAYQQALHIDANYLPAYKALAGLYQQMDDHDHAVAAYQKALQVAPTSHQLWFDLGMCYAQKKDWASALPNLSKAAELDPENRQYVNTLGFALARAGRYDESVACFARVQSKAKAHYNLARMLEHMQQTDQCKLQLQLALQADPRLEDAQDMLADLIGTAPGPIQRTSYQQPAAPPGQGGTQTANANPTVGTIQVEQQAPAVARAQVASPEGPPVQAPPRLIPPTPPLHIEPSRSPYAPTAGAPAKMPNWMEE